MVVEPNFSQRYNLVMLTQGAEIGISFRNDFGSVVGMYPDGGGELRVALGETDGAAQIRGAVAGADGEHVFHPGLGGAREHGVEVLGEFCAIEMAVGVD